MATRTSTSRTRTGTGPGSGPCALTAIDAHDDDQGVDRVGVEEPAEQEAAEARAPRGRARSSSASWANEPRTSRASDLLGAGGALARGRRGRSGSRRARTGPPATRKMVRRPGSRAGQDQQRRRRSSRSSRSPTPIPDRRPARPGCYDLERRVVVDQRRLVGEVRDRRTGSRPTTGRARPDQRRRDDAEHGEEQQERQPPAAAVAAAPRGSARRGR